MGREVEPRAGGRAGTKNFFEGSFIFTFVFLEPFLFFPKMGSRRDVSLMIHLW